MALEALKGEPPSKEQDIYSLGIVLYEMLFGVIYIIDYELVLSIWK